MRYLKIVSGTKSYVETVITSVWRLHRGVDCVTLQELIRAFIASLIVQMVCKPFNYSCSGHLYKSNAFIVLNSYGHLEGYAAPLFESTLAYCWNQIDCDAVDLVSDSPPHLSQIRPTYLQMPLQLFATAFGSLPFLNGMDVPIETKKRPSPRIIDEIPIELPRSGRFRFDTLNMFATSTCFATPRNLKQEQSRSWWVLEIAESIFFNGLRGDVWEWPCHGR